MNIIKKRKLPVESIEEVTAQGVPEAVLCCLGSVLRPALSPPPFGWCCFPFSPLRVGLLGLLLLLVVLPSFPSFWWDCLPPPPLGGAAFPHLLKGGVAWFPSSLGGVAFHLSFVVVLLSFTSVGGGAAFLSPLQLGGAAWFLPSLGGVAFPLSTVGSCFVSFGWCCCSNLLSGGVQNKKENMQSKGKFENKWQSGKMKNEDGVDVFLHLFGGAAFLPLPLRSGGLSPLSCWVVLLGLLLLWVVLLSKINKKRCKVKGNLKTVAKWKNEK